MTLLHFSDAPETAHRAWAVPGRDQVNVDGNPVDIVPDITPGAECRFIVRAGDRALRLQAVADGDTVYVHAFGRSWRLQRVDPTRGHGGAGTGGEGLALAPMPGVVVSWQVSPGARVAEGEAMLVIESMKLQTTLTAACAGTVAEMPLAVGQTFQRGAVLARVHPDD